MNDYLNEILNHPVDKLALLEWPSMVILDANQEFCDYFNYSKSELLDRVFHSLIWKNVPREKLSKIEDEVNEFGFCSVLEQSQEKWLNITRVQDGKRTLGLLRVLDLPTNKKIIERELAESEQRFKTLADVASEGVCFIQEGSIVDANEQLARIFSVENSQALCKRKLNELLAVSDVQRIMASAEISAINRNEVRSTDSSGRLIFLEITGSYLQFRGKRTLALVFNDISNRKRTEQALHQSLVSFQRLLEDSPNGVVILTDGKIQYLNQAACKLFGVKDEDEVFGDAFENYVEEGFREEVLSDLQDIREGGDSGSKEVRMVNSEQEIIDVEIKSALTVYENRPSIQVTIDNITDRNKLVQEQIRVRFVEEINAALKAEIDEHRATQLKLEQQQRQTLEQTAKIESIFNSTENLMMWTLNHDFEITELNANFIKNMESSFGEEVKLSENIMAILQRHVDHNFYQGQLQAFNNGFKGRPQQFELTLKNE
jgi:PAS domain S-box-containing protein